MKKLLTLSALLSLILFSASCVDDGPPGPPGPRGPEGPAGASGEIGYVFEYDNINFTAANDYAVVLDYPEDFEGRPDDVVLVYLLWGITENDLDLWRPLPLTRYFEEGILQYDYDFTSLDTQIFLHGTIDLNTLGSNETDEWVARVVIVPGEFWDTSKIDFSDYYAVKEALGLPEITKERKTIIR